MNKYRYLVIALAVILVVLAGGWWYFSHSTQPVKAVSETTPLKTYTNSQYGFSIAYPNSLTPDTSDLSNYTWYSNSENQGTTVIQFSNPQDPSDRAQLQIGFSSDPTDVAQCLGDPDEAMNAVSDDGTVLINGASFRSFVSEDVASGHTSDTHWYKTVHDGSCWAIGGTTEWTSDPTIVNEAQEQAAASEASSTLDQMVMSFRFK